MVSPPGQAPGVGLDITGSVLAQTPIRQIDFSDPADRSRHDRLVELVAQRLSVLSEDETALDRQIDDLVADLYGLEESDREQLAL